MHLIQMLFTKHKNNTLKEMMNPMSVRYIERNSKDSLQVVKMLETIPSILKIWGCFAKVEMPTLKKIKIDLKIVDYIFISYAHKNNTFQFLVYEFHNMYINKNMIIDSRNASFFKDVFLYKSNEGSSSSKWMYNEAMDNDNGVRTWTQP